MSMTLWFCTLFAQYCCHPFWNPRYLSPGTSEKSLENFPTAWIQTKAALSSDLVMMSRVVDLKKFCFKPICQYCVKSVQSTLCHLITTSVPRAMFTLFLVEHGWSQYYLYWIDLPGGWNNLMNISNPLTFRVKPFQLSVVNEVPAKRD